MKVKRIVSNVARRPSRGESAGRVAAKADDADVRYKLAVLLLETHSRTNDRRQLNHWHATAIQAWLDTFAEGEMPTEAAAFMYLAAATEEIRGDA